MIYPARCFLKNKNSKPQKKKSSKKKVFSRIQAFLAFYNLAPKNNDVSWIHTMFLNNNKVFENKLRLFLHAQSITKWPTRSVYIGNFINYLSYFLAPFPKSLGIYLEGNSKFLPLVLSMLINILGLFSHFYGTLLNCLSNVQVARLGLQPSE